MKTQRELVQEAIDHERARRWSQAMSCWKLAAAAPAQNGPAARGSRRGRADGIAPGTVLRHRQWGKVTAECTFVGEGNIVFAGVSYTTLSEAANAAAAAAGKKSKTLNGWVYWGVDRQEQDRTGWDQTAGDVAEGEEGEAEIDDEAETVDDEIDARVDAYLAGLGLGD